MLSRLVRDIFRPARHDVGAGAKKFTLCAHNGQNLRLMASWASIFAEIRLEQPCWSSFFADQQSWDTAGRVCCAVCLAPGPFYWHP
jgi:hypothetical protein